VWHHPALGNLEFGQVGRRFSVKRLDNLVCAEFAVIMGFLRWDGSTGALDDKTHLSPALRSAEEESGG